MSNADAAKELREKLDKEGEVQTQEALALQAEGKQNVASVEKLQEELDNTKSMLKDVQADKEGLQKALDTAKSTEAENVALLAKRDEEIATLTSTVDNNASDAQAEITTLKAEATTCKEEAQKEVTALKEEIASLTKDAETSKSECADLVAELKESKKQVTALKAKVTNPEKK